jgi:hypothetical protein
VASTLTKVRSALKYRMGALLSSSNATLSTPELNEMIQANCRYLAGRVPLGETWAASLVTVAKDANTAALGANNYSDILEVRRHADAYSLTKRTREEMSKMFPGSGPNVSTSTGELTDYCLVEDDTQTLTLYFNIKADAATALDVCRRVMPADLTSDAGTTGAIPFSMLALEALIDLCAIEAVSRISEKALAEVGFNPQVLGVWSSRAEQNIKNETERIHRQRGVGRPLRFVG